MSDISTELYLQYGFPVFQNRVYLTKDEAQGCSTGDIRLVEDLTTGLVHNTAFNPALVIYDDQYNNEQALSPHFRSHLEWVANLIESKMGRERLVEVGCGKGFFLELLTGRGVDVAGFDPTYEGHNPRVRREYFRPSLGISGEALILRHVLEHIPDPVGFLHQLAVANGSSGLIYIEVPCFEWICHNRAWFDVFYEHVNYFRLSDFRRIFGRVIIAEHSFGGQYLSVIADLASLRSPQADPRDRVTFPKNFLEHLSAELYAPTDPCVIWGGSSKGVIFALMRARAGKPVDRVIDINPAKQGRYLPGTGLRVLSPNEGLADLAAGATMYVMNPNYMEEIREMSGNAFTYIGMSHG